MSHDVYIIIYSLKVIIRHVVSTLLPSVGSSQFGDMFPDTSVGYYISYGAPLLLVLTLVTSRTALVFALLKLQGRKGRRQFHKTMG